MTPSLLLFLLACDFPTDDTGGDDTGTTSATPVSLDALFLGDPDFNSSCQWSYSAVQWGDTWLASRIALPDADRLAAMDVSYDQALGPDDEITVGTGTGTGQVSIFDCSDVVETMEGVHQWDLLAGSFTLDAVYVGDHPEWTCTDTYNPVYDGVLTLADLHFSDSDGELATATTIGPFDIRLGQISCGG